MSHDSASRPACINMAEPHVEEIIQDHPDTCQDIELKLTQEEEAFLLLATGVKDMDTLKAHILRIQTDAAEVFI